MGGRGSVCGGRGVWVVISKVGRGRGEVSLIMWLGRGARGGRIVDWVFSRFGGKEGGRVRMCGKNHEHTCSRCIYCVQGC